MGRAWPTLRDAVAPGGTKAAYLFLEDAFLSRE